MSYDVENSQTIVRQRIKELRIASRLTQAEIAANLGISASSISAYETGGTQVDFTVILKYCNHFGVDPNYFTENSGHSKRSSMSLTTLETQLILGYRRRHGWMKKIIRELCFNGPTYRSEEEEYREMSEQMEELGKLFDPEDSGNE